MEYKNNLAKMHKLSFLFHVMFRTRRPRLICLSVFRTFKLTFPLTTLVSKNCLSEPFFNSWVGSENVLDSMESSLWYISEAVISFFKICVFRTSYMCVYECLVLSDQWRTLLNVDLNKYHSLNRTWYNIDYFLIKFLTEYANI